MKKAAAGLLPSAFMYAFALPFFGRLDELEEEELELEDEDSLRDRERDLASPRDFFFVFFFFFASFLRDAFSFLESFVPSSIARRT